MRDFGSDGIGGSVESGQRVSHQILMAYIGKKSGLVLWGGVARNMTEDFRAEFWDSRTGGR